MSKSPNIPPEFRQLPLPSPLDNYMFAANFTGPESIPSAMSLINAVLQNAGRPILEVVDELNCEKVLLGESRKLRGCRLDLAVKEGNHLLNLEVQMQSLQHMADRMIFNLNRMLGFNTISGTEFEELPRVTVISILNFLYRRGHPDFHQPFGFFYEKNPERVTEKHDFHMLETPKFRLQKPDFSNSLHRWLFYLDSGYREPDSPIVKGALQMDEGLYQFARQYQRNVCDPKTLYDYYGYVMECMTEKDRIDTARNEGIVQGVAQGVAQGITQGISQGVAQGKARRDAEIAKKALSIGMSMDDITVLTGLSHEEVKALAND